ncbi:MAG: tyrosine--tRNA ligase [Luteibaculaceae bacterium]
MKNNLIEELRWRGLVQDIMPGTENLLQTEQVSGYVGFDPTANSLHIGHFAPIMLLVHLQKHGHIPVALVGGATGRVGDPSGKAAERSLLPIEEIEHNVECIKNQLSKFLDFEAKDNPAILVNNYDWFKNFSFLDFIRDIGKHISVNYMLAKDSVKSRLENGMSFTEFTYQLIQGYDYLHLYKHYNCKLQMGGSDQWGNITTGTELVRRVEQGEAFAFTAPLVKKADGTKFGKSEGGNIWLDKKLTSPFKFYQYWLNTADADAENYIKIFSLKSREEIEALIEEHQKAPHLRVLQQALGEELCIRLHGKEDYEQAIEAGKILFSNSTEQALKNLSEEDFLSIFEGVPTAEIVKQELEQGLSVIEVLVAKTEFLKSNGEARRAIKENSIALNKEKVSDENLVVTTNNLIAGKYLLLQRGKKNYCIAIAV